MPRRPQAAAWIFRGPAPQAEGWSWCDGARCDLTVPTVGRSVNSNNTVACQVRTRLRWALVCIPRVDAGAGEPWAIVDKWGSFTNQEPNTPRIRLQRHCCGRNQQMRHSAHLRAVASLPAESRRRCGPGGSRRRCGPGHSSSRPVFLRKAVLEGTQGAALGHPGEGLEWRCLRGTDAVLKGVLEGYHPGARKDASNCAQRVTQG
jgi:hypothetical protein